MKTIRRAIETYGESPAAEGEIRDGNDTTSPVSIALAIPTGLPTQPEV